MLSGHDESLFHQAALPFSQTVTTDHRFYDRVFFAAFAPDGSSSAMLGMGVYKNMNVIDGFACVVKDGKQHNIRASRPLRPQLETEVGPIRLEVIEPLKRLRFSIAPNEHGVALDLEYTAEIAPFLEGRWEGNHKIIHGRLATDTQRFDGIGRWNGWIEVDGERIEVRDWCGGRDHSWGTRGGVGGYEPVNGPSEAAVGQGFFLGYFVFGDGRDMIGYCIWTEDGSGRYRSLEGALRWREALNKPDLQLVGLGKDVHFPPDRRQYDRMQLAMQMEDGSRWLVEGRQALPGTVLKGYGGHGEGFKDKRGFGVYRGHLLEADVYDLQAEDMKALPVETPLFIRVNGQDGGYGWGTVLATGELSQYGLKAQTLEQLRRYSIAVDNLDAGEWHPQS
ncbi:MAG: hypothetical protein JO303_14665 [Caulobacteraceae bacterium]|nr:hypothetical protein [Caulobacteraceae bacterium]